MIKFFRKIRQKLLTENKFSKYLLYAFGEIILVIIGILIALSINNWNEEKKLEQEVTTYLKNASDFIYNTADNTFELVRIQMKDSVQNSFLKKDSTIYKSNTLKGLTRDPLYFYVNSEFNWDNSFDIVLENQKLYPDKYDEIISLLREMKAVKEGFINESANTLLKMTEENEKIIASKFEWYPYTDEESDAKRKAYYFTDFQYYNRLYNFRRIHSRWVSQTLRLRALQIELWIELKLMNAFDDNTTFQEGLKKYDMNELQVIGCKAEDEPAEKSIHDFFSWSVLINTSKDTLFFTRSDMIQNGEYRWIEHVLPREAKTVSSIANGYLKILEDKKCTKLLKGEINGYWINE